jgi:predicted small lipoprotein YifL
MRYVIAACFFLSACGQAGDLYLPSDPSAQPAPQGAPATPASPEEKKKESR